MLMSVPGTVLQETLQACILANLVTYLHRACECLPRAEQAVIDTRLHAGTVELLAV